MLKKKIFFYVWDGGGFFHKTETKKSFGRGGERFEAPNAPQT